MVTSDEANQDVIEKRIAALKHRLDAQRPLSQKALKQLNEWYNQEITWSSNAIEGNTLTRQESTIVINEGITIGGKKLKDQLEAVDHFEAVKAMREIASQGRPITEHDVLRLHEIILKRSQPEIAGRYATSPRRVQGSPVNFPNPAKIPDLMADFGKALSTAKGWKGAFEAHFALVSIHPFVDGNGRTARLLMNMILIRDGYTPVLIGPQQRSTYLELIQNRQLAEPLGHGVVDKTTRNAYLEFMAERLTSSMTDYVTFLEQNRSEKGEPEQGLKKRLAQSRPSPKGVDWP